MADRDRLERLYDYTKFHIGMYTALLTAMIAIAALDSAKDAPSRFALPLRIAAVQLAIAGGCGGVVASWTPKEGCYDCFMRTRIGILSWRIATPRAWIYIEHLWFWSAVIQVLVAVFVL